MGNINRKGRSIERTKGLEKKSWVLKKISNKAQSVARAAFATLLLSNSIPSLATSNVKDTTQSYTKSVENTLAWKTSEEIHNYLKTNSNFPVLKSIVWLKQTPEPLVWLITSSFLNVEVDLNSIDLTPLTAENLYDRFIEYLVDRWTNPTLIESWDERFEKIINPDDQLKQAIITSFNIVLEELRDWENIPDLVNPYVIERIATRRATSHIKINEQKDIFEKYKNYNSASFKVDNIIYDLRRCRFFETRTYSFFRGILIIVS